ncbi:MAG: hypothetical protein JO101_06535, partial [Candidatus Eremiobacteraeota bacterium]|nr:hypothetical protein [Candidatus Eremiobacteraeota bacterium]
VSRLKAAEAHAALEQLGELRARIEALDAYSALLEGQVAENERRRRVLRATQLRSRLLALRAIRDEAAALQAERGRYDDVVDFPVERVGTLAERVRTWELRRERAEATAEEAQRHGADPACAAELDERELSLVEIDDVTFASLEAAATEAERERNRAASAGGEASIALHDAVRGAALLGGVATASAIFFVVAIVLAILHLWIPAAALGALGAACAAVGGAGVRARAARRRRASALQAAADDAVGREGLAARTLAGVLEPLGMVNFEELKAARDAALVHRAKLETAAEASARANGTHADAEEARDALIAELEPLVGTVVDPLDSLAEVRRLEMRRRARDGVEARLGMLEMRRGSQLGAEDEFALERELEELIASGAEPLADLPPGASLRTLEAESDDLRRQLASARNDGAQARGTLAAQEAHLGDVARLDEIVLECDEEVERLERFKTAATLAKDTLERRTQEAHREFARRLEDYSANVLGDITAGRYGEIFIDPATLAINVRVPEARRIVKLDRLSAGTREQISLTVRFAMARMLSEGLETPPLLLDDPFAHWDDARLERCFPILEAGAREIQTIVFTTSRELAHAAQSRGAALLELDLVPA